MKTLLSYKYSVHFIIAIWVIFWQMFCNIDSYLYVQTGQFDSACFFMCGKAMMNGMVPYAEFADSKGPLLWLLYGIGYLIDHYSYIGVFWLACGCCWITLLISYKTAKLWLSNEEALLAAMAMTVPLFYWNFYTETKAEHFCWPFVAYNLYILLKMSKGFVLSYRNSILIGLSFTACLMLKWSVAFMMLSFIVSIGYLALEKAMLRRYVLWLFVGIASSLLPFALYFIVAGNSWDFIQEYFLNTAQTVSMPLDKTIVVYGREWLGLFTTKRFIYLLYIVPAVFLWKRNEWYKTVLPLLCGLFFIAISIHHDNFGHYISVCGPFAIIAVTFVFRWFSNKGIRLLYQFAIIFVAMCYVVWGTIKYGDTFCTKADSRVDQFMRVSYAMSQVDNPTIIIIGQERGLAMATTLPGTRYWITQMGRSEEMLHQQEEAIWDGHADFVVLFDKNLRKEYENKIIDAGYHYFFDCYAGLIYTKHAIELPKRLYHLTVSDIILKRNYLEFYQTQ